MSFPLYTKTMTFLKTLVFPFTHYKYLLLQLTQREIKARYKQSFIGYAWVILNPLSQLLVYSFVFSVIFRFSTNNIPYIIFLYAALLPWGLFQGSIFTATQGLVDNSSLLRKVAFPREIIIYAIVLAKFVDFFISAIIFSLFMMILHVPFSTTSLWVVPLLAGQLLFTVGISFIFSTSNLFYRDIQYLANLLLMLWMYMTPIVYPLSLVPSQYVWLYKLNPMVGFMEGYRSALFHDPFEWTIIVWSLGIAIVIFKKAERTFADVA